MDEALREALRQWRANPADVDLQRRAASACRRASEGRDLPLDLAVALRWSRFAEFVEKWLGSSLLEQDESPSEAPQTRKAKRKTKREAKTGKGVVGHRDLDRAEERLGVRFPDSFREAHRLLAHRAELLGEAVLIPLKDLERACTKEVVGVVQGEPNLFGVPRLDAAENPPIVEVNGGNRRHPALPEFLLAWVMGRTLLGRRKTASGTVPRIVIEAHYRRLPVRPVSQLDGPSFYGDDDTIILDGLPCMVNGWRHTTFVLARSKEARERVLALGGLKAGYIAPPGVKKDTFHDSAWDWIDSSGKYRQLD